MLSKESFIASQTVGKVRVAIRAFFLLLLSFGNVHAEDVVTHIHTDALGSPVAATTSSGDILWRESYKPYGERIITQEESASNDVWYTGRPFDIETGLSFLGARDYDSIIGRFYGVDSIGFMEDDIHTFNRYAYTGNNPYRFRDPDGKAKVPTRSMYSPCMSCPPSGGGGGGGGGVVGNSIGGPALQIKPATTTKGANPNPNGGYHKHHSDPKFMGGKVKQPLTRLSTKSHQRLHKEMNDFLRQRVDSLGRHMRPQRGNSGARIRRNFTRSQRLDGLKDFYRGPGAKFKTAAKDFFKQHPGLLKGK